MAVAPAEATFAALSDTVRLEAEAFDANAHVVEDAEFSWESGDATVATVDASGLVTAVGNGTATVDASGLATAVGFGTTEITAMSSGATGTALLQVVPSYTLSGTVTDGRKAGLAVPGAKVTLRLENGGTVRSTDPAAAEPYVTEAAAVRSDAVTGWTSWRPCVRRHPRGGVVLSCLEPTRRSAL